MLSTHMRGTSTLFLYAVFLTQFVCLGLGLVRHDAGYCLGQIRAEHHGWHVVICGGVVDTPGLAEDVCVLCRLWESYVCVCMRTGYTPQWDTQYTSYNWVLSPEDSPIEENLLLQCTCTEDSFHQCYKQGLTVILYSFVLFWSLNNNSPPYKHHPVKAVTMETIFTLHSCCYKH